MEESQLELLERKSELVAIEHLLLSYQKITSSLSQGTKEEHKQTNLRERIAVAHQESSPVPLMIPG